MTRVVLAVWLALFAVQTSDVLLALAPDDCVEDSRGSGTDSCPDQCARCACCARVPTSLAPVLSDEVLDLRIALAPIPADEHGVSAEPEGILHVPKAS